MPYIPPSVVREVKRMDLLTYLKNYEPYELVHFSGNTYTTRTHDSLKISNGKWMWWSQRTGGRSALDYLIKVRGYSFLEAVEMLAERANIQPPLSVSENVPMEKQLLLPKKNQDDQKVIAYLSGRGIDKEIIQFCLESGRVYESAFHHNVVFVGMDEKDNPKYAAIRGTGSSFIGEANGSDKNYSFSIFTEKPQDTVHLFESAIDLLSYATLQKLLLWQVSQYGHCPNEERLSSSLDAFLVLLPTLQGLYFFQFLLLADRHLPVTINVLFSTPSHPISTMSHKITDQWLTQTDAPYHMISL